MFEHLACGFPRKYETKIIKALRYRRLSKPVSDQIKIFKSMSNGVIEILSFSAGSTFKTELINKL